uniref:CCHC-type domain-containing protein n=1 Tax=Ananas comosus var. bracteatus TaxID=296719 RepID=A0A6V7PVP5_ANACO|nr:unnamed protein product [Ananas comosus var. bracteatus]
MHDGQSVHDHCLTMIKDLEELEKLGVKMDKELQVDLILQSLPVSYGQFIVNYHMNKIDCTNAELLNMLVTTEGTLKSSKGSILAVERASSSKRKSNWKKKPAKKQKTKNKPKKEASKNKAADKGKCFHCNVDGHWKRNCPVYLESLKNKRKDTPSEAHQGKNGGRRDMNSINRLSNTHLWESRLGETHASGGSCVAEGTVENEECWNALAGRRGDGEDSRSFEAR